MDFVHVDLNGYIRSVKLSIEAAQHERIVVHISNSGSDLNPAPEGEEPVSQLTSLPQIHEELALEDNDSEYVSL